jgi:hypothetical protein
MIVQAPISVGELIDKITILEIKTQRIFSRDKRDNIQRELALLETLLATLALPDISTHRAELKQINSELWDIENYKRACEQTSNFDLPFIEAARNVYLKNDLRAEIKREINLLAGSDIVEEKSY